MKIRARGSGKWQLSWELGTDAGGKRLQRHETVRGTKREAERRWREVQAQIDGGSTMPKADQTLDTVAAAFWPVAKTKLEASTFAQYHRIYALHVAPELGHVPLRRLTPQVVQAFLARKQVSGRLDGRAGGLSPRYVGYCHAILRRILAQALEWELVSRNAASFAHSPSVTKRPPSAWTEAQARQFLAAIRGHRLEPLWRLALATGMREGELIALPWRHVDLDAGTLEVRVAAKRVNGKLEIGAPKTKAGTRAIALDASTVAMLRHHRADLNAERMFLALPPCQGADFVFQSQAHTMLHPRNVLRAFVAACKRAQVPVIHMHDLRHTNATLLLERGVHPKVVSERLGHARIGITLDTYTHVTDALQREAAAALESVFEAVPQAMGAKRGQIGKITPMRRQK